MPLRFASTKKFEHAFPCAFRQWRAASHCRFLHGYALSVALLFETDRLDSNGWVVDFGAFKSLKAILEATFDHKTLVAADDPDLAWFQLAHDREVLDLNVVDATGCEAFAGMIYHQTSLWLELEDHAPRVRLLEVEVSEHQANSAIVG